MSSPLFSSRLSIATAVACGFMLLAAAAPPAHAEAPPIKAGLWEITPESQMLDGKPMPNMSAQLAEQLKKMPPEMRKQMEAHMKAQGVQMVADGGQPAVRMCLTKAMLDQGQWQKKADGQCQNTGTSHSGNTWSWKFKCTQPPSEGEGSTTFQGSDAYLTEMNMNTQREGKAHRMSMKHRGRWLGADCGDVKPLNPPAAK
jgi:hypothetical protein